MWVSTPTHLKCKTFSTLLIDSFFNRDQIEKCSESTGINLVLFFVNFFILGYVGLKPAEGLYLLIARLGLIYYFGFFLIITPFINWIEKPKTLPASISDIYLGINK